MKLRPLTAGIVSGLAATGFTAALLWAVGAYVVAEVNPLNWGEWGRFLHAWFSCGVGLAAGVGTAMTRGMP